MTKKRKMSPLAEHIYRICVLSAIAAVAGLIFGATGAKVALIIFAVILGIVAFFEMRDRPSLDSFGYIILALLCGGGALVVNVTDKAKCEYEAIIESPSADKCRYYLMNHTHLYVEKVMDIYLDCAIVDGIFELDKLADNYPQTAQGEDAAHRASVIAYELYKQAEEQDYTDSWENYYENVPEKYHADAKERAERAELRDWGTDESAWKTAQKRDELKYYQKYLEKYPKGEYTASAKKGVIDTRVRDIMVKSNGKLPSATKISSNNSSIATQRITNNTGYTLTVLYSGAKRSYEFTIEPNQTRSFNILVGSYNIAATVPNPLVIGYYKNENYSGGVYDTSYYIIKSRFRFP